MDIILTSEPGVLGSVGIAFRASVWSSVKREPVHVNDMADETVFQDCQHSLAEDKY